MGRRTRPGRIRRGDRLGVRGLDGRRRPTRTGSVYFERGKPGFREGTYRWEITAYDEHRRSVHVHESGEFAARLEVRTEPINDYRTRYEQVMHFRAIPAFRPLGYVLERTVMKRRMQRDFDEMILPNFKRIAERRAIKA